MDAAPAESVKSDVRGSRPAGALFEWNGDVYRPAQDSSGRYGYAISINRIANSITKVSGRAGVEHSSQME